MFWRKKKQGLTNRLVKKNIVAEVKTSIMAILNKTPTERNACSCPNTKSSSTFDHEATNDAMRRILGWVGWLHSCTFSFSVGEFVIVVEGV